MLRRAVVRRVIVEDTSVHSTISSGLRAASGGEAFLAGASVARDGPAGLPAGSLVLGTRLLLRRSTLYGVSLRWEALLLLFLSSCCLGRQFGKVFETFAAEVLQHLPDDGSGKLEVQGEALRVGEGLVCVPLVAEGTERPGDVLGRHEGVAAGRHAQVLEERKIQAPHHADDGLGLVDAPPHEEACIVAIGPASQDLALVHVVVLGNPVLELPEQPACKDAEVLLPEEPAVALDAHDGASTGDGQRLFLVLECLAELADHAADLILTTSALLECARVDHQRGFRALPGYLVDPARRPLEPPVVVLEVLDLPGRRASLFR